MTGGPAAPGPAPGDGELGDLRFSGLLGPIAWAQLPPGVQRRFSKRLGDGHTAVYAGAVVSIEVTFAGRVLASLARLIGGPLPLVWEAPTPSVVTVTECGRGGQIWTRLYARPRGFPQMIHSEKRFAGPTGLEEHVGMGVGMALAVSVEAGALVFRSAFYFIHLGAARWRLPAALTPGSMVVTHTELDDGRFAFTLAVDHPCLGPLIRQRAEFSEETPI
jgi:hypothetical protein